MMPLIANSQATADRAKYVALITCLMSIPLLFPPTALHGVLLDWWLLSIYAVPVLILLALIMTVWTLATSKPSKNSSLRWNLLALSVGVVAVVVEFALIRALPKLP